MAQSSWPLVGVNLSDVDWRDSFGQEAGVTGDYNGTAYKVTLAPDSDVAQIGSTSQKSTAQVAGFGHRIPAGQPENITIPAATGSARTDIIALRYDPAFTGAPGPVRLVVVTGSSTGLPVYDDSPPGIEDLPLWAVTRQPGQALSQATVRQLFPRIAPALTLPGGAPLPLSSPLGTRVWQAGEQYLREVGLAGVPVWSAINARVDTGWQPLTLHTGWSAIYAQYRVFDGVFYFTVFATRASWQEGELLFIIPGGSGNFPKHRHTHTGAYQGAVREVAAGSDGFARMAGGAGFSGVAVSGSWPIGG